MTNKNERRKIEISYNVYRMERIFKTNILEDNKHPLFASALIESLIVTRDLLEKTKNLIHIKIDFKDDVIITEKIGNVYDLIIFYRNAACHKDSNNHLDAEGKVFSFNSKKGKGSYPISNYKILQSDYEDDICIFLGEQKLYIQRHLIRACKESINQLEPHFPILKVWRRLAQML
ncbi:hypothetical protein [Terrimonas pollutisoli]|uniref:hypothetical protein n=1 Tax=Terrimonas pollutisoli TaxID=3034147 RepID=UPI0023EC4C8E|nr:hypothetical protein [Terrimonas sp. H1YJ31]